MKKIRVYMLLAVIVFTSIACGVFGGGERGGSAEITTGHEGDSTGGSEGDADEWLALSSANFMFGSIPNYIQETLISYEGVDKNGEPLELVISFRHELQTEPSFAERVKFSSGSGENADVTEIVSIGEESYMLFPDTGCVEYPYDEADQNLGDMFDMFDEIEGEFKLVKKGVSVNGVLTDQYEITEESFNSEDELIKIEEGSLFVAREGGYIVRIHITGFSYPDLEDGEFDPSKEIYTVFLVDFTPMDGPLAIFPPEGCEE